MLGLGDFSIFLVYILCILSASACVLYGILNWNKGNDTGEQALKKEKDWEQKEQEIKEKLEV